MRKFLLAGVLFGFLNLTAVAGEFTPSWKIFSFFQNEKKKKITEEELPVIIKNMLKSEEYKYWKVDQVFLIEGTSEYYRIELKKDDQKQTLNLDKYGNKVNIPES